MEVQSRARRLSRVISRSLVLHCFLLLSFAALLSSLSLVGRDTFMGVPGLWEAVRKAGQSRLLVHLAFVDGFEANKSGKRAYRVGIDASIW